MAGFTLVDSALGASFSFIGSALLASGALIWVSILLWWAWDINGLLSWMQGHGGRVEH